MIRPQIEIARGVGALERYARAFDAISDEQDAHYSARSFVRWVRLETTTISRLAETSSAPTTDASETSSAATAEATAETALTGSVGDGEQSIDVRDEVAVGT